MDWVSPYALIAFPFAVVALWWFSAKTLRPIPERRKRALLVIRTALVLLALLALAGPAWESKTELRSVIFVIDHSQSQGEDGWKDAIARTRKLAGSLDSATHIGYLSAGATVKVIGKPEPGAELPDDLEFDPQDGGQTNLAAAVDLARCLFPPGASRRIVVISDGLETQGNLQSSAAAAGVQGVTIDIIPTAGKREADVRVVRVVSSKSRAREGATIELRAEIESSVETTARVRLFENGIEVDSRNVPFKVGERKYVPFIRTPEERNLYRYRVRIDGIPGEKNAVVTNDEAMAMVDVFGRPLWLYIEGETDQSKYLQNEMQKEGINLVSRPPEGLPKTLAGMAGFDGIIVSDVPAHKFTTKSMTLMRQYVEELGGGFVMIGGKNSFGVGGYYRTPIEEILPVKMKAPDKEERYSVALALVIDKSGSMSGQKIEICKSAAVATVDLLTPKDYVMVVGFDSRAHSVVPMTRVSNKTTIASQVRTLTAGGGTNIMPGMTQAQTALKNVKAKVKHMIVLTDGQTGGSGYPQLAATLKASGVTVSTVGVGSGAAQQLLQQIAASGGGKYYYTTDPKNLPRIFTQDAMTHMGRLIREDEFKPRKSEDHAMLAGVAVEEAPSLHGYVKTNRREGAQYPWVTDLDDPLLATWQSKGLGKVTAFTSDCKSRWAEEWVKLWPGYSQFWAQVLRDTARKPQGVNMDIRLVPNSESAPGSGIRIETDVRKSVAEFNNETRVAAEIYFVPTGSGGSEMKPFKKVELQQTGSGKFTAEFLPKDPGLYLVRARSGADLVSAGIVHQVAGEAATGQIDSKKLERVADLTGGDVLRGETTTLSSRADASTRLIDLTPWIVRLFLVLFLADILIRRWDNILGFAAMLRGD